MSLPAGGVCRPIVPRSRSLGRARARPQRSPLRVELHGEPPQPVRRTPIASGGAQSPTIDVSSEVRAEAPKRRAPAPPAPGHRAGGAAVGARRPLRDAGRGRGLASGSQDAPARRTTTAGAPRALRARAVHARTVPREHPQPRRPDARPRAHGRHWSRDGSSSRRPMRSRRGPRRAGGSSCWPTSRGSARRSLPCSEPPRWVTSAVPGECWSSPTGLRRSNDRPLVPHDRGAGQRRPGVGRDHVGPPRQGDGPRLGRDHRGRGPRPAAYQRRSDEAVGPDTRARQAPRPGAVRHRDHRDARAHAAGGCPTSARPTRRCSASR